MNGEMKTVEVRIQDGVYEGVWHNPTLAPDFKEPNTRGDSLSSSLVESRESPHITLEIDKNLLAAQRSEELTSQINEAYGNELEPEEREFLELAKESYLRQLDTEE